MESAMGMLPRVGRAAAKRSEAAAAAYRARTLAGMCVRVALSCVPGPTRNLFFVLLL